MDNPANKRTAENPVVINASGIWCATEANPKFVMRPIPEIAKASR